MSWPHNGDILVGVELHDDPSRADVSCSFERRSGAGALYLHNLVVRLDQRVHDRQCERRCNRPENGFSSAGIDDRYAEVGKYVGAVPDADCFRRPVPITISAACFRAFFGTVTVALAPFAEPLTLPPDAPRVLAVTTVVKPELLPPVPTQGL